MNKHGLTKENLVATLPPALRTDPSVVALAEALGEVLAVRPAEIDRLRIYPAIDTLDEPLLDILARDFKVDWWDPEYSIAEKQRTLKGSWYVHKKLGTAGAVKRALGAIYPGSDAEPWFKYEGGMPYHFRLHINLTGEQLAQSKPANVIEKVRFYQSLRDHMDGIQYTISFPPAVLHIGGGTGVQAEVGVPAGTDAYDFQSVLAIGGAISAAPSIGVPHGMSEYLFSEELHVGGVFSMREEFHVPEDVTEPPKTTILRTGGVCTMISNP